MAHHGVGPPQGLGGAFDVTGCQAGAHVGRGPDLRTSVQGQTLDVEVVGPTGSVEGRDVPGGLGPEPEVGAHHHHGGVQPVDQHPVDELLRAPGRDLPGERDHEHVVDAGLREQHATAVDIGQRERRVLGTQHRHRVRVEGHRDQAQPVAVGELACPADHVAVPEVDAVEVADDDHGATEIGRHVVKGTPDTHAEKTTGGCPGRRPRPPGRSRRPVRRARGTPRRERTAPPGRRVRGRSAACGRPGRLRRAPRRGQAGEAGPGRLCDRHERERRLEVVEGVRGVEVEGPDGRTPERGQVASGAEPLTEVPGDRADVGAAGALDGDAHVGSHDVAHLDRGHTSRAAASARPARPHGRGRRHACRRP